MDLKAKILIVDDMQTMRRVMKSALNDLGYVNVDDAESGASAMPIVRLLNSILHRAIREQGGAYGAGADQDANSASFRFFSYRDPRVQGTLDDYGHAIDWVLNEHHEWQQIEEAILGVISAMDRSTSPAGAARQAFFNELFGRDRAHRMAFRERVLDVNLEQLREVAARYLKPERASTGIVSHKEAEVPEGLDTENL